MAFLNWWFLLLYRHIETHSFQSRHSYHQLQQWHQQRWRISHPRSQLLREEARQCTHQTRSACQLFTTFHGSLHLTMNWQLTDAHRSHRNPSLGSCTNSFNWLRSVIIFKMLLRLWSESMNSWSIDKTLYFKLGNRGWNTNDYKTVRPIT